MRAHDEIPKNLILYAIRHTLHLLSRPGELVNFAAFTTQTSITSRIHNAYLLASSWNIVSEIFMELAQEGLTDKTVKLKLKGDEKFRGRYLALCDMVSVLVNISQAKFSVLATTARKLCLIIPCTCFLKISSAHYARYFKQREGSDPGEAEIIFDWAELREACVSFLDSIIIELCFPRAPYPQAVLYQVLRDAVEESPKEAKRFPQALWDAVGDLSVRASINKSIVPSKFVSYS
jgi:hypothetical protein